MHILYSYAILQGNRKKHCSDKQKMTETSTPLTKIKARCKEICGKADDARKKIAASENVQKLKERLAWNRIRLVLASGFLFLKKFTLEQPKTASFIYVCLFCAFSIRFFDEPLAVARMRTESAPLFTLFDTFNPSGWWFFILLFLWLTYMAAGGLSLTTEAFEKNLGKAKAVAFVFLTLLVSSAVTFVLNIIIGRYTPAMLDSMHLYGFSAFRMRVAETSFPSFGAQSIWAVAIAAGSFVPRLSKLFYVLAALITLSLVMTAECYLSDAVMGTYVGIIMYGVAKWIVSENRENTPLISI